MINQIITLSGFRARVLIWALFGFFLTGLMGLVPVRILDNDVEARLGRLESPTSVAGVSRRSTRRTVRRHHYARHRRGLAVGSYVTVLPSHCTTVLRRGVSYRSCDNVYYRSYYEGSEVVYIVVERP